ncbi:MAG TPA: UDP-3-O-acyl-N-acetylglucosamine deacetylase [Planctomycetota bacterium]
MAKTVLANTLRQDVVLKGIGLHSGAPATVRLRSAPPGIGIVFVRTDLPGQPSASARMFDQNAPPFRTVIKNGAAEIHTVEHLLAAFAGLQITDCRVEIDALEMPGMDGSALEFAQAIVKAGVREDPTASVEVLTVREPVVLSDGAAQLEAHPYDAGLKITYTLDYKGHPLAQGTYEIELTPESFLKEIAPARTFAVKQEAERMRAAGLGKGANYQNTVVVDGSRALETTLRFDNEPIRHKILDLVGDLYVLGRPLHAHIVARYSGHKLNRELARKLGE